MVSRTLELREPWLDVLLENPAGVGTSSPRQIETHGVLDTGATLVVLPWYMTLELGLTKIGKRDVRTPSGMHRATVFDGFLTVPSFGVGFEIEIASIREAGNGDIEGQPPVLLGRSFLQHFHFCMLGPERRYTLAVPV